ncbi:hypothetical protein AB0876_25495 [Mycobacterium sp. NPDC049093]
MSFPPQGPPPYGQPPFGQQPPYGQQQPHWAPYQGQPWQVPPPPPPSSRSGLIVGVVVVAVIAAFGALLLIVKMSKSGNGAVSDEQRAANPTTAEWPSDFKIVCKDGSVSNAASYAQPYKYIGFFQGMQDGSWYEVADQRGEELSEINIVACLSRKTDTEVKSGQCESSAWDKPVTIDHYSVQYEIEVREARTGRFIKSLGTVDGPAGECPSVSFFDWVPDKLYGEPDGTEVEAKMTEFAG